MPLTDVEVVNTDQTRPLTQAGFGLPLVVGVGEDGIDYAEVTSPAHSSIWVIRRAMTSTRRLRRFSLKNRGRHELPSSVLALRR